MEKKKKLLIIGAAVLAVCAAVILAVTLPSKDNATSDTIDASEPKESADVVIEDPSAGTEIEDSEQKIKIEKAADRGLTPKEEHTVTVKTETYQKTSKKTVEKTAQTVTRTVPEDDPDAENIIIGGGEDDPYNCGTPGHHCDGPETHAYILNLELEGCPYCGNHDCASFYATDEWGNTCYTPAECPSYDVHKDPTCYCQTCGKMCGDGTGGTCVQFVNACLCPNCGEPVDSFVCHSCK